MLSLKFKIIMKQLILIFLTLFSINSIAQSTNWTENKLKEYWKKNGADEIEGIYVRNRNMVLYNGFGIPKTMNIVSDKDFYIVKQGKHYILGSFSNDIYGILTKIIGENKFLFSTNLKYWGMKDENKTFIMYLNNSKEMVLEDVVYVENRSVEGVHFTRKVIWHDKYLLVYKPQKRKKVNKHYISSGSGFAISSNGIIATNYHVIENAKTITIRGVNGTFDKIYKAKILVIDKNNDLALIKIDDSNFTSLGTIPYIFKKDISNVGENVFALGYPLRAVMGNEIKLTNGIISSKTGFQGDVTSYQVSVPVQPGNSGGPLFDSNGNVIGIINAKLIIAENAAYAVKISYLMNLIELLNNPPKLPTYNSLKGKSLAEQVKLIKKFVYIIEAE